MVGPWGDALVEELIPQIENCYRVIPDGDARFLAGQSSGGWACLWLQMSYPETFGRVLNDLDAEAHIEVIPGRGHDVWSDEIRTVMHAEIDRACP